MPPPIPPAGERFGKFVVIINFIFIDNLMFQPVQKIYIDRMNIPVHHNNDRQSHTYFCRRYNHYKEHKELAVYSRTCIFGGICQVMHL